MTKPSRAATATSAFILALSAGCSKQQPNVLPQANKPEVTAATALPHILPRPNLVDVHVQVDEFRDALIAKEPQEIAQFFDGKFKEAVALGKQTQVAHPDPNVEQQYVNLAGSIVYAYQEQSDDVRKTIEANLSRLEKTSDNSGEKALAAAIKSVLDKNVFDPSRSTHVTSFRTADDELKTATIKSEIDAAIKANGETPEKVADVLVQYLDKALKARAREEYYYRSRLSGMDILQNHYVPLTSELPLPTPSFEERKAAREADEKFQRSLPTSDNYRDAIIRVLRNRPQDEKTALVSRFPAVRAPLEKIVDDWRKTYPLEDMSQHEPLDPEIKLFWLNDFHETLEKTGKSR